jgi:hypothetical protein
MKYFGAQKALSTPTCDERRIFDAAMEIVERLGGFPYGVSLVGVRVAGLERISAIRTPCSLRKPGGKNSFLLSIGFGIGSGRRR